MMNSTNSNQGNCENRSVDKPLDPKILNSQNHGIVKPSKLNQKSTFSRIDETEESKDEIDYIEASNFMIKRSKSQVGSHKSNDRLRTNSRGSTTQPLLPQLQSNQTQIMSSQTPEMNQSNRENQTNENNQGSQTLRIQRSLTQNLAQSFQQKLGVNKNGREDKKINSQSIQGSQKEDDEIPLKAFQIAKKETELKKIGIDMTKRRDSFFKSNISKTSDPINKLLQSNKYIGQKQDPVVVHVEQSQIFQSQEIQGQFKNEMVQKNLNHTLDLSQKGLTTHRQHSDHNLSSTQIKSVSNKPALSYRERLFIKNFEIQQKRDKECQMINKYQLENKKMQYPIDLTQSLDGIVNDSVQQALIIENINIYNSEHQNYASMLIHLGVLLKKAQSVVESQNHSTPCYFMTTVCCQILDKLSVAFPNFQNLFVPLKNTLFQSIFAQYDAKKHQDEDEREMELTKSQLDINKKNPKIQLKYMKYETYHDKFIKIQKQLKEQTRKTNILQKEITYEKTARKIITNLIQRTFQIKNFYIKRAVFDFLKLQAANRYQKLFAQIQDSAIFGSDIKRKTTLRKYFMQLKSFALEEKNRKLKKEIEHYQNKFDEIEYNYQSVKAKLMEMTEDNIKLKSALAEKMREINKRDLEFSQMQKDNIHKKPQELKKALKIYFKYLFSNPMIMRIRLLKDTHNQTLEYFEGFQPIIGDLLPKENQLELPPSSAQIPLRLNDEIPQNNRALLDNQVRPNSEQIKVKNASNQQKIELNLHLLLKKKESLKQGGQGVAVFSDFTIKQFFIRWVNFMMDQAIIKVNEVIQILEKDHKVRQPSKIERQDDIRQWPPLNDYEDGEQKEELELENGAKKDQGDKTGDNAQKLADDLPSDPFANIQTNKLVKIDDETKKMQDIISDYRPYEDFRRDLDLILSFRDMISRTVTDLQANMINDGILMALTFLIDNQFKEIEIAKKPLRPHFMRKPKKQDDKDESNQIQELSQKLLIQGKEFLFEDILIHDYAFICQYVLNTNPYQRAKMVINQIERVFFTKIDWYVHPYELLSSAGNIDYIYTCLLSYVFYQHCAIDKPIDQLRLSPKKLQMHKSLSEKKLQSERKKSILIFRNLMQTMEQKARPLLQKKVHFHLHDMSLLYSQQEFSASRETQLQMLFQLPSMSVKKLMIRWVNHLLRSYDDLKTQVELEGRFKKRYQQENQIENLNPSHEKSLFSKPKSQAKSQVRQQPAQNTPAKESLFQRKKTVHFQLMNSPKMRVAQPQSRQHEYSPQSISLVQIPNLNQSQSSLFQASPLKISHLEFSSPRKFNYDQFQIGAPLIAYEVQKSLSELSHNGFYKFTLILAYLSPETLWEMYEMDNLRSISKTPHIVELIEQFIREQDEDMRKLFIINAFSRITKKNHLLSMNDLYSKDENHINYVDLLLELFMKRPSLSNSKPDSLFMSHLRTIENFYQTQKQYLGMFDKDCYDNLQIHINQMINQRDSVTESFIYIQDIDRLYITIREKFLWYRYENPLDSQPSNSGVLPIAYGLKLHIRSEQLLQKVEEQLLTINRDYLFQLVNLRQPYLSQQWANVIEGTLKKYKYPLRRYLNLYIDQDGYLTYFDLWRAIKSLNFRSFVLDSREVEHVLVKIIKLKQTESQPRFKAFKSAGTMGNFKDLESETNEYDLFMKKVKSELLYSAFQKQKNGVKFSIKSNIAKEIEESLENALIKTQLYRTKFTPSDFILVLLSILFRISPSAIVSELSNINPSIKDQGMRQANKLLSKDKMLQHVEMYIIDCQPGLLFENFLIHCLFQKSDFIKRHPFRFNMMREDFRAFLDNYLNSLFAVFDFYIKEFSGHYPQPSQFQYLCLQPEIAYIILQDFDAFNAESGLCKSNFRKILTNLLKQIITENKVIYNQDGTIQIASQNANASNNTQPANNKKGIFDKKNNAQNQAAYKEEIIIEKMVEGFKALTFFEFMELLYLVAQYFNPDPFVNPNQKFADFLERVVLTNIQFKIKSKKLTESPHKNYLVQSLSNQKVIRGTNLETFNAYFDIQ